MLTGNNLLLSSPCSNGHNHLHQYQQQQQLNTSLSNKINTSTRLQQQQQQQQPVLAQINIDDKSLKDIVDVLGKQIDNVKNLTEFSQVLQIQNISKVKLNEEKKFFKFKSLFKNFEI